MAFGNKPRKPIWQSSAEKEANQALREARKKRFPQKTVKITCRYVKDDGIPYDETGWYADEADFLEKSGRMLELLREWRKDWRIGEWHVVEWKVGPREEDR